MSNFSFIKTDFPDLYADAREAEQLTYLSPKAAAILCRSTLENAINWLYDHDAKLVRPWRPDLSTLMHEHEFRALFNATLFAELNLIRKTGNIAAHGKKVSQQDALASLKYLFRFLRFLAIYYGEQTPPSQLFDEALIPNAKPAQSAQQEDAKQIKKLLDKVAHKNKQARQAEQKINEQAKENAQLRQQLEQQRAVLSQRKVKREQTMALESAVPLLVSEAETRRRYIDLSLKEAGWDKLQAGYDLEYEVTGMPHSTNPSGIGYVDYVLWGDDGRPLAVVEAKKAMASPLKGKHQALKILETER
jgi:type I restriction enzyme R subunit